MEKNILEANRQAWNEATSYHQRARKDRLRQGFKDPNFTVFCEDTDGEVMKRLKHIDFKNKKIAQPSCNNGRELLSLMRLGATEGVGFDISDVAIAEANVLSNVASLNATFERTDILEIDNKYNNYFDIVYISEGSIQWIEDIDKYMQVVSRILKKGGILLMSEMHPFVFMFDTDVDIKTTTIDKMGCYFDKGPHKLNQGLDYVGRVQYKSKDWYYYMHKTCDIINAVIKSGIQITEFEEFSTDIASGIQQDMQQRFPLSFILCGVKKWGKNMLFQSKDGKVKQVKENDFKLEKDIQNFVESNMLELLNMEFITSEFSINNFRIDSLAYDIENNAFMIVEYKRGRNESLIDQGYTYLNILFDRKADFVLKYNEVKNKSLKINDIDWEQSRVVFISPKFTDYQIKANDFKNNPIELVQIKKYENDIVELDVIKKNSSINLEIRTDSDDNISKVTKQIKIYTEDEHIEKASEEIKELYFKIKEMVLDWDDIKIEPKKLYLAFKGKNNILDIVIQRSALKIFINLKQNELDDPKASARNISSVGHWGNGDFEIIISNDEKLEYILSLIKQSWNKNKN